ncbi:reverse transcriptase domain-containing protein [Tanacetum coccineum]
MPGTTFPSASILGGITNLGYQNPFHLKKAQQIKPTLYDGSVIAKEHDVISHDCDEETLIWKTEEDSRLKELKEDFSKCFVTQKELSAEQAFWLKHSNYYPDTSVKLDTHVRVEAPSELPKVSLVNESLKKLKYQLASFDKAVKKRTTSDAITAVAFRKHTCFIRELEGVDLLKGSRGSNLYTLSMDNLLLSSPICLLSKASKTKSWLWHQRLPHLNFDYITFLAKQGLVRGLPKLKYQKDHLCSACALGKSKKHSHKPKAEDSIQEKLYLLHMDLCGSMRIQSINEFVIKFLKMIQVRMNATIRNIKTDNGTEFVNQTLRAYYEEFRISHQTSVACTPQQNGIVKRRNCTLVEAARTIKTDLSYLHVFGALCYPTNDGEDLGTDISKITRKPSRTGKPGHENRKSTKEAKDAKPKPKKVNLQSKFGQTVVNRSQSNKRQTQNVSNQPSKFSNVTQMCMRTRSQARNRNRRQQQLTMVIVEEPEFPMADNRTMAQMLQAPIEGYEDAIVVPPINANNFELKQPLINLVQSNKFTDGEARDWLDKEPPRSILTWDDLVSKFINQFFPPSKTTYLRNEITTFYQKPNETFNEAWERFKGLLRQCPHHGFSELHQLDTFYNSLNTNDQDALDSAAGGNFLDKMPRDGLAIIESKSKVRYSRIRPNDSRASTNAPSSTSSHFT